MTTTQSLSTRLTCYRIHDTAPELVPGTPGRWWMDMTEDRFAYRCIPLSVANSTGWELLSPRSFSATWNGGQRREDISLTALDGGGDLHHLVNSHFQHGILTFHTGYLFRTDPGWGILCRGAPNTPKDGIAPLDGLIETDWLPFTFTMNWQFTRPGSVTFMKGEPFCFIMPMPHLALDEVTPVVKPLASDPALQAEYDAWNSSRNAFNAKLAAGEPETVKEAWQRFYLRGTREATASPPETHRHKRRLAKPVTEA